MQTLNSSDTTYAIVGIDQYGDEQPAGALYSVYAKDASAAVVTKGSGNQFDVRSAGSTANGKETVVVVKPTEKEKALEMKVKVPAASPAPTSTPSPAPTPTTTP